MAKQVLVVKVGSALLNNAKGNIDNRTIKTISDEIGSLSEKYNMVLVSSGSVSSGKKYIKGYKGSTLERKAASAIGNPLLLRMYGQYFSKQGKMVAQVLCERHHFSDRHLFLQMKNTFHEFWKNNIIPIVNENDMVSNFELRFSDNDELATLIAVGFDAQNLILCTSAGGFRDKTNNIVPLVDKIGPSVLELVRMEKSAVGLGGMLSKLTFSKLATSLGIQVVMCGLEGDKPIKRALTGTNGTVFLPKKTTLKSRNKWLASSSVTIGEIILDDGAVIAVSNRHSLLTVGVISVNGKFLAHEFVKLLDSDNNLLGVSKVKLSSKDILASLKTKHVLAAHADDIVLL
ncbi:MAG: glutamate 5-kinase [Pseudopedobacter saltans]|uniref:Glutamate 5-kinase n=1 Tax=Pseudopedobacter saltans TaxID=151895 RepID=A0A2W5EJC0_9SPHI|nr:MAG: glutamate 5-kinase [Pseudopedobacter saltans]